MNVHFSWAPEILKIFLIKVKAWQKYTCIVRKIVLVHCKLCNACFSISPASLFKQLKVFVLSLHSEMFFEGCSSEPCSDSRRCASLESFSVALEWPNFGIEVKEAFQKFTM